MIRKNQKMLNLINVWSDAILIFVSYLLAVKIRFDWMNGYDSVTMLGKTFILIILAYSAGIVFAYYVMHLYSPRRLNKVGSNNLRIVMVNTVGALGLLAAFYWVRVLDVSRIAIALFWMLSTLAVMAKQMVLHIVLRYYRSKGYNQKHFILVGNGKMAHQYLEDSRKEPYLGICVDGYVSLEQRPELGVCLGSYEQLSDILEKHDYDGLIVALEPHETRFMKHVLEAADKEGIDVKLIPFYSEFYPAHPTIERIGSTPLVNLRATPLDNLGNAVLKRLMDIVGALVLIVLASPAMAVVAIGVKLSSPGPVLFAQKRVGRNQKSFMMHKFRSMRTDVDHEVWTTNDDPRKTWFGSIIRKYSLDELPQLFDVLVGNMSLVGPRPELPRYVRQFKEEVPLYLVRQQVRPGMTGWAQINGLRGDTSIEDRVKYDIWYIENWSIGLDIRILLRTAFGGMKNNEQVKKKAA